MAFVELFGDQLLTKEGIKPTETVLSGKSAIGIYFSGHWCPPCRAFTPELAKMYSEAFSKKGLEIVFVSSDRDAKSFESYYNEMPWVAVPFSRRAVSTLLNKKYKVQGVPSLVILGPDGTIINAEGRQAVSSDPKGERYPWSLPSAADKAKAVFDIFGADIDRAAGKAIGIYFSAHWCPPCRSFTPQLAQFYTKGLKDKMEIFFVSSDEGQGEFDEYVREMPWKALPFEKRAEKEVLSNMFGVGGIPCLVVLNSDGTVVTTDGRSKVMKDPDGNQFPHGWLPQPFNDANDDPGDLNREACLIALGDDASLSAAVKTVAEEYFASAGREIEEMPFRFFRGPDGDIVKQVRSLTNIQDGSKLLLLDLSDNGAFYVCERNASTPETVRTFLEDYRANKLQRQQLSKL